MNTLCAALLGWAALLSGFERPELCPHIVNVDETFMEREVGTRTAFGWYPGEKDSIYIDFDKLGGYSNTYLNSVIVHEMVHWLQHVNGMLTPESSCHDRVMAERQAYYVQREFMGSVYGNPQPVGINSMLIVCNDQ